MTHPHHTFGVLPPLFAKRGGEPDLLGFGVSEIKYDNKMFPLPSYMLFF